MKINDNRKRNEPIKFKDLKVGTVFTVNIKNIYLKIHGASCAVSLITNEVIFFNPNCSCTPVDATLVIEETFDDGETTLDDGET